MNVVRLGVVVALVGLVAIGCDTMSPVNDSSFGISGSESNPESFPAMHARGIVSGVNVVTGGVGMDQGQPETFSVTVPVADPSEILAATFYWNGSSPDPAGDETVVINGTEYTGVLVDSYMPGTLPSYAHFYKLDGLALVAPGMNTFTIDGIDFLPNGLGLLVEYGDAGSTVAEVMGFDLSETFWWGNPARPNGEVHNFTLVPAEVDRSARLIIMIGDCDADRSDRVWYHSGPGSSHPGELIGGPYDFVDNVFNSAQGPKWDIYELNVTIPAGAEHFAFQIESPLEGNGDSGAVSYAGLLVEEPECTGMIGDFVWDDLNVNGLQDAGEPGIAGVTVELWLDGQMIATDVTDAGGIYGFDGLCAGEYTVVVDETTLPMDYVPSPCNVGADDTIDNDCSPVVVVLPTDNTMDDTIDFGYYMPETGAEGCTLGYWKNHEDSWPPSGYSPGQSIVSVFSEFGAYTELSGDTLMDGLNYGGGKGVIGGVQILMKQAVAALLNASHPDVEYPRTLADVIADVNAALASGDRDTMVDLGYDLDQDNMLGCPLD